MSGWKVGGKAAKLEWEVQRSGGGEREVSVKWFGSAASGQTSRDTGPPAQHGVGTGTSLDAELGPWKTGFWVSESIRLSLDGAFRLKK